MQFIKSAAKLIIPVLFIVAMVMPGCQPAEAAEGYMAVVPRVLHSGTTESLSMSLFNGDRLAEDRVEVVLLKDGDEIAKAREEISGKGTIELDIPDIEAGEYQIRVKGTGFEDTAPVIVEHDLLIFLETDKPIYKPGQTMHMRVITLDSELRPVGQSVTVEVMDAKGTKIFRTEVQTDEFGMASIDLPISAEPNLGVWKITAADDKDKTQLDVKVEEYVLPKYEVAVDMPREWFLVGEPITGEVTAQYSFGRPVSGELEIRAFRYVGEWQEYATASLTIDGEAEFELPAVGYVAGVPAAGGLGNVRLEFVVEERATGYQEETSELLTVAESPVNIRIIPEGSTFKPGLPFSLLVVTETPDGQAVDAEVRVSVTYITDELEEKREEQDIETGGGKELVEIDIPKGAVAMIVEASTGDTQATRVVEASYSPSGNFIHLEQISDGIPEVGDEVKFRIYATREAVNFYYEVVSRGRVVFSDYTQDDEISFDVTPLMAPSSRLLVYQILPNSEVAADYLPFEVVGDYPHQVTVGFGSEEARPGDEVDIDIGAEGRTKVGIVAVDKSVFILAENRLNLQQVFDELERLYMEPRVELHEASIYPIMATRGAKDIFEDAGVVVLSNQGIPEGKDYGWEGQPGFWDGVVRLFGGGDGLMVEEGWPQVMAPSAANDQKAGGAGLAEVERIRQYFPETWLWEEIVTDSDGSASLRVEVPDTITTWVLRAVAISQEQGLGIAEDELVAFQPFFVKVDLPYSAIRGEEFPVKVAIYNYLDQPQDVLVQVDEEGWFDLLDEPEKTVGIAANDIGGVEFMIRPTGLGINEIKVTARGQEEADAVIKMLIVEPEGVARELVENLVISGGDTITIETMIPADAVDGSGRVYLAVTSSYLTQTIEGLEGLIQMPFGCGEQNMIVFAPDVYITKYLQESRQLKPEIMAKAEKLMITGYQRELTYRRSDGSFSAFGQSDQQGSLWLTAFVLKSFSQAEGLIYIDDAVLDEAGDWITAHQNSDGSFDPVGFVHHQEMMGGLQGKTALTAYVAIALIEAGDASGSASAIGYLEDQLVGIDDPYTMAITAYALELAGSGRSDDAYARLMEMATGDEDGLHWGAGIDTVPGQLERGISSADIETTAYATLALTEHGDAVNASAAARWLVSQRNAYGGFGSTQDTVVALQALTEYSTGVRADVDLDIALTADGLDREIEVTPNNFDVLQVVEMPVNESVEISAQGDGEAIVQVVRRFNLPDAEKGEDIFQISVDYDTAGVEVDDLVTVSVELEFNPPLPMEAGMVVLDISVPTGFAPVIDSIDSVAENEERIKRYDVAGRKVIFYIEDMAAGDSISFSFKVQAMYPVKAKGTSSQVYSYYKPELKGETLGEDITVW